MEYEEGSIVGAFAKISKFLTKWTEGEIIHMAELFKPDTWYHFISGKTHQT